MPKSQPKSKDTTAVDVDAATFIPPSVHNEPLLLGASYTHYSPVPPALLPTDPSDPSTAPPCILGVDEAGRGPVLGPMVYGVFYLPLTTPSSPSSSSESILRTAPHRFDDSKILTPAVRSALMAQLCDPQTDLHATCGWATTALSARDIAAGMLRAPADGVYNLNAQAMDATVELVRGVVARGVNVVEVYVDTVGPPAAYEARLQRLFPAARVTVAKKADSLYPCVSAASVCAKVTRDAALEALYRERRGRDGAGDDSRRDADAEAEADAEHDDNGMAWGSGYPSDARCTAWLRRHLHPVFGWGPECRFSWATARDMLEANGVRVDWPDDDDDDADNSRLTDYFVSSDKNTNELGHWFGTPAELESF